jgi:putative phosphoesterase
MVGVMSDSHDNVDAVRVAVAVFKSAGCELVVHAGDFVAPFAARELANLACPAKAVFGNCDGEKKGLTKALKPFGEIKEAPFFFSWGNSRFLLIHEDYSLDPLLASHDLDFIVFGHTHKPEIRSKGKALLVNPGETGGWVSGKRTVALLDAASRAAEIVPL